MTGIADLAHYITKKRRTVYRSLLQFLKHLYNNNFYYNYYYYYVKGMKKKGAVARFVILCWRRTGSNLLCGMLYKHPQIMMHNELFNETSIHSYYPEVHHKWTYASRELLPDQFLSDMFDLYKSCDKPLTKAVGFKSFPEHFLDNGKPNCLLDHTFQTLIDDHDVLKIILHRENAVAVYISMVRSKMTGNYLTKKYDDVKITIKIPDFQSFLDRYQYTYRRYHDTTFDQQVFHIKYEDFIDDELQGCILARLQSFLGVDVLEQQSLQPLVETVRQSDGNICDAVLNYDEVEFAYRHTYLSKFLPTRTGISDSTDSSNNRALYGGNITLNSTSTSTVLSRTSSTYIWGLLLPIRSFSMSMSECRAALTGLYESIIRTTSTIDRSYIRLYVGIDMDDTIYNTEDGRVMIHDIFKEFEKCSIVVFGVELRGKICAIWSGLAKEAYVDQCDFTVLLGDDVRILSENWKESIEATFNSICTQDNLPFGVACVAFEDVSFSGFPTFPVIHRKHLDIFDGLLFPKALINQGGDPFLFALYKRFNASRFCYGTKLENLIGGKEEARYKKHHMRWNNEFLTTYITTASSAIGMKPIVAVDIVVPTYRCDTKVLKQILALRASVPAIVSFWIVIDNPSSPFIDDVRRLECNSDNYSVNIREHRSNWGASAARNTGMDYSDADWIILLDDDVTPDSSLLDAYIGGIFRFPNASVLVGSTHLPIPHNLVTKAMVACDLIGSYVIAERRVDPPWGVTANLCVKGRSSRVRFDLQYPKTGGGEDIDYCIRAAKSGITSGVSGGTSASIVAVPGALADHPWWDDGRLSSLRHIMGWAVGESLCVSSIHLKEHVYFAAPNAIEICLVSLLVGMLLELGSTISHCWLDTQQCVEVSRRSSSHFQSWSDLFMSLLIILVLEILWHSNNAHRRATKLFHDLPLIQREFITLCGAVLVILQEYARCVAHIRRGAVFNLCWRFDWLCGKNSSYIQHLRRLLAVKALFYLAVLLYFQRNLLVVALNMFNSMTITM